MLTPKLSKRFLKVLGIFAFLWLTTGVIVTHFALLDANAFLQIYFATLLDLVFLILLFWAIFYSEMPRRIKALQIFFFLTFKLVCLGFLAITLKRLRNASDFSLLFGVGFVGVGPLLSGFLVSRFKEKHQG